MKPSADLTTPTTSNRSTHRPRQESTSEGQISPEDYRALAEFRHLIRQFLSASADMASARCLTPQQHQMLLAIAGRPPDVLPTVGYLAERLLIKHHSAVGLIDRLEEQGLVERDHGTADRRQVLVQLTNHGSEVLANLATAHRSELRALAPRLVHALGTIVNTD